MPVKRMREPRAASRAWLGLLAAGLALSCSASELAPDSEAGARPESASGVRLTVFDCGRIAVDDVEPFGLTKEETPVRELFVPCYLVEHPDGRLLWDAGLPIDLAGKGETELEPDSRVLYDRALPEQLAEMGLAPEGVDCVAFSHMHFDHVGAANLFPHATLLIQRAEHEAAFGNADATEIFDPTLYAKLADAETVLLDGDHDVFGDGRVRILSAPGHTPGHQVLLVELDETGPVLLSGDLYHFRANRRLRRVPAFNTDREATLESMDRIEAIVKERGATFWIEHDLALAESLDLAPAHYD